VEIMLRSEAGEMGVRSIVCLHLHYFVLHSRSIPVFRPMRHSAA